MHVWQLSGLETPPTRRYILKLTPMGRGDLARTMCLNVRQPLPKLYTPYIVKVMLTNKLDVV